MLRCATAVWKRHACACVLRTHVSCDEPNACGVFADSVAIGMLWGACAPARATRTTCRLRRGVWQRDARISRRRITWETLELHILLHTHARLLPPPLPHSRRGLPNRFRVFMPRTGPLLSDPPFIRYLFSHPTSSNTERNYIPPTRETAGSHRCHVFRTRSGQPARAASVQPMSRGTSYESKSETDSIDDLTRRLTADLRKHIRALVRARRPRRTRARACASLTGGGVVCVVSGARRGRFLCSRRSGVK
jgi:hypothetical protein